MSRFGGAMAEYFYDFILDGMGDTVGDCSTMGRIDTMFKVTNEDAERFEELRGAECVVVTETDDGFVNASTCTLAEWEHFVAEQNADDDD